MASAFTGNPVLRQQPVFNFIKDAQFSTTGPRAARRNNFTGEPPRCGCIYIKRWWEEADSWTSATAEQPYEAFY